MKKLITILLCLVFTSLQAQQTPLTSGGDASGSGGAASYSIGQIIYTTATGSNGSVAHGVQQAFEISIVLGIEDDLLSLSFVAFPNPTTNILNLKIDNPNLNAMEYALFDIQGRLLKHRKITSENTTISTENLATAIYFLKVIAENNVIKIFKIIKN